MKTILITGATDGIGLETAKLLLNKGHRVLIHGRNPTKTQGVMDRLAQTGYGNRTTAYQADLSDLESTRRFANSVLADEPKIDVLINNAGVFKLPEPITPSGMDARIVVNTLAPWLITHWIMPVLGKSGRVVNLSSAAQAPVDLKFMRGEVRITNDFSAYAQSKLALTMWSQHLGLQQQAEGGPMIVSVNPGSLLGSKMVKEGFGVAGGDLSIGADILARATLSAEFADAHGKYYDNDAKQFALPHAEAANPNRVAEVVATIKSLVAPYLS